MAVTGPKTSTPTTAPSVQPGSASKSKAAAAAQQAAAGYSKAATTGAPTKEAANVQISPKAKELSLARAAVESTPDIREDKVADLKSRIASGQYQPDAGKIADGIAREAIKDELAKNPDVALE